MCDACVTNAVKARMLSRRSFLKAAPAAAVAGATAATFCTPPAALAAGHSKVVDLTHTLSPDFPTYSGAPGISLTQKFNFNDNGFNLWEVTTNEHTGTHLDAPLHFSPAGQSVDELPVEDLVCALCVVHIHERAAEQPDAVVTPDDLMAWISNHGPIPDGACVAMHSGWENHIGTEKFRNADADGVQHFPGFHVEAAHMLIEETNAAGIAVDTLSLDIGAPKTFDTHYAWLPASRWGLENVANLASVPAAGATLIVGAPKHKGGSGGPARVIALV